MNKSHHTQSAGGVVLNKKGQMLVVNQRGNSWSLPKGHIDPGEDAFIAAKREIHEETGITENELEFLQELGSYTRPRIGIAGDDDTSEWKTITFFLFKTVQEALQPQDPHNPEAKWVEKEKVVSYLTHAKDKEFFIQILPCL